MTFAIRAVAEWFALLPHQGLDPGPSCVEFLPPMSVQVPHTTSYHQKRVLVQTQVTLAKEIWISMGRTWLGHSQTRGSKGQAPF